MQISNQVNGSTSQDSARTPNVAVGLLSAPPQFNGTVTGRSSGNALNTSNTPKSGSVVR